MGHQWALHGSGVQEAASVHYKIDGGLSGAIYGTGVGNWDPGEHAVLEVTSRTLKRTVSFENSKHT